jgi:replicative DNA helicase
LFMGTTKTTKLSQLKEDYYPNSYEDENYIISQMYYNLQRAEVIIEELSDNDFFNTFNRDVFKICRELTLSSILITSHSINQEYLRTLSVPENEILFDSLDVSTLQMRYKADFSEGNGKEGIKGAIKRLKQDSQYREIIYRAKDALLMAQTREGLPMEIASPLETLAVEFQAEKRSIIVWADEAEREAQETYSKLDAGLITALPTGFPEIDEKLYGGGLLGGGFLDYRGSYERRKNYFCPQYGL